MHLVVLQAKRSLLPGHCCTQAVKGVAQLRGAHGMCLSVAVPVGCMRLLRQVVTCHALASTHGMIFHAGTVWWLLATLAPVQHCAAARMHTASQNAHSGAWCASLH